MKKKKIKVTVFVEGGVVTDVISDSPIVVDIVDFDNEGVTISGAERSRREEEQPFSMWEREKK